jgi:glycerol kinase
MQFQSDLLNVPVVRPRITETTALGAAYLAGLAVGYWTSQKDIATQWQQDKRFSARMKPAARKQLLHGWNKALARAHDWDTDDA